MNKEDYDIVIVITQLGESLYEISNPWVSDNVPKEIPTGIFKRDNGEFAYSPANNSIWLSNKQNIKQQVTDAYTKLFINRIEIEKDIIPYKFIVIKKPLHQ